jgi:hypothetical protein
MRYEMRIQNVLFTMFLTRASILSVSAPPLSLRFALPSSASPPPPLSLPPALTLQCNPATGRREWCHGKHNCYGRRRRRIDGCSEKRLAVI